MVRIITDEFSGQFRVASRGVIGDRIVLRQNVSREPRAGILVEISKTNKKRGKYEIVAFGLLKLGVATLKLRRIFGEDGGFVLSGQLKMKKGCNSKRLKTQMSTILIKISTDDKDEFLSVLGRYADLSYIDQLNSDPEEQDLVQVEAPVVYAEEGLFDDNDEGINNLLD